MNPTGAYEFIPRDRYRLSNRRLKIPLNPMRHSANGTVTFPQIGNSAIVLSTIALMGDNTNSLYSGYR